MNSVSFKLLIRKDFVTQLSCQALGFVPQIQWAEISLCSAACCGVGDGDWENLSQLFTITQLSLHTLHTVVTGSLQGGGRLRAFVEYTHTCSEHFLFLTRENHEVEDKGCVELAT